MGDELRVGVKGVFMGKDFLGSETQIAEVLFTKRTNKLEIYFVPHEFVVRRSNMQLEICPALRDKVTVGVRAVEPEENKRVLHHFLGLKEDRQSLILERYRLGRERQVIRVLRCREYDGRLWFLTARSAARPSSG